MCPKIKSKFVKWMGAWPIRRSNPFTAGPARASVLFAKEHMVRAAENLHDFFRTHGQLYLPVSGRRACLLKEKHGVFVVLSYPVR